MALIKTSAELKRCLSSIDKDYNIASLQSFIDDAEFNIIIPWIGQEIYTVIANAYNTVDPAISGKKAQLLLILQRAVTNLAFMLGADSGSFRIADSGFYVISSPTNKPVSDKKMSEFKAGRREAGYQALESAIEYLEANINDADFVAYKDSAAHDIHRGYFINGAADFTRYFRKIDNSSFLYWQLQTYVDFAERKWLQPVLGADYFTSLKTKLKGNTLTDSEKDLLPYIKRALAQLSIAKGVANLPVEFDGTKLIVISSPAYGNSENVESKAAANQQQISSIVSDALNTGTDELRNLENYLIANAADLEGYTPPESTEQVEINSPDAPIFFV